MRIGYQREIEGLVGVSLACSSCCSAWLVRPVLKEAFMLQWHTSGVVPCLGEGDRDSMRQTTFLGRSMGLAVGVGWSSAESEDARRRNKS